MTEEKLLECTFCNGVVRVGVCDDEGNYPKHEGYENDPWSGLSYCLLHDKSDVPEGKICPIATGDPDKTIGMYLYDSRKEAITSWNSRVFPAWLREKIVELKKGYYCSDVIDKVLSLTPGDEKC